MPFCLNNDWLCCDHIHAYNEMGKTTLTTGFANELTASQVVANIWAKILGVCTYTLSRPTAERAARNEVRVYYIEIIIIENMTT